jgi:membrane protease YdiL (CAAX protease family)
MAITKESEKTPSPKNLWVRILVVAIAMILAFLTTLAVVPVAKLLNVNPSDLQGTHFKISFKTMLIIFGYSASQFILIYVVQRFIHRHPFRELGFRPPAVKYFLLGLGAGLLLTGCHYILEVVAGSDVTLTWSIPSETSSLTVAVYAFFTLVILLTINSLKEELVFRAYPIEQFITGRSSMILIVVLVSLFFSAVHHIVEPFTFAAFIQRFLIALLFAYVYVQWRSIWLISGIHNGSNTVPFLLSGNWKTGGLCKLSYTPPSDAVTVILFAILIAVTILIIHRLRPARHGDRQ